MNSTMHEQKINSTAQELSENGYKVLVEPLNSDLPFDLGGYRPDIIATKGDLGIVLEVKTTLNRLSVDRFQDIAERVASHHGWRFLLVTLDDITEKILPSDQNHLPSWEELNSRLLNLSRLVRDSLFEPALLFLWSILEAALRKRAISQNIPIWRFPVEKLLNHIFSSGEISISEFDLFKSCLELRNKAAHGIQISIDPEILKSATASVGILVEKWRSDRD
jgi:Holliday junction resolvase